MIRHDEFFVIVFEHVYTYHDDTSKIITVPLQLTDFGARNVTVSTLAHTCTKEWLRV